MLVVGAVAAVVLMLPAGFVAAAVVRVTAAVTFLISRVAGGCAGMPPVPFVAAPVVVCLFPGITASGVPFVAVMFVVMFHGCSLRDGFWSAAGFDARPVYPLYNRARLAGNGRASKAINPPRRLRARLPRHPGRAASSSRPESTGGQALTRRRSFSAGLRG